MSKVVAPDGTGRKAGLANVSVAGKTGTAQKLDLELKTYSQDRYIAWFIGVVPANDPELAIVVAVDEPMGRLHSGGGVAAPLFARVAAAQLARRGIATKPAPMKPAPALPVLVVEAPVKPKAVAPEIKVATTKPIARNPNSKANAQKKRVALTQDAQPPTVAVAAPPAGLVAHVAAGPLPSRRDSKLVMGAQSGEPAFVPDFSGQTMIRARSLAKNESLTLDVFGASTGRVVSQLPVPGTVLEGTNRTVLLEFAPKREDRDATL
jgi:hypothetical protein